MSGLIDVSWILLSASALLPYCTLCSPSKLHWTLWRVWEWKRPKRMCLYYSENNFNLADQLKRSQGPPRGPRTTVWEPLLGPIKLTCRQKRVLNSGWWSWWVSLGKREEERKQMGPHPFTSWNDRVVQLLSLSVLTGVIQCWWQIWPVSIWSSNLTFCV